MPHNHECYPKNNALVVGAEMKQMIKKRSIYLFIILIGTGPVLATGDVTFTSSDGKQISVPQEVAMLSGTVEGTVRFAASGFSSTSGDFVIPSKLNTTNLKIFLDTLASLKQAQNAKQEGERPRDVLLHIGLQGVTKSNVCALLIEANWHGVEPLFRALARKAAMLIEEGELSVESLLQGLTFVDQGQELFNWPSLKTVYSMYVLEYHKKHEELKEACNAKGALAGVFDVNEIADYARDVPRQTEYQLNLSDWELLSLSGLEQPTPHAHRYW